MVSPKDDEYKELLADWNAPSKITPFNDAIEMMAKMQSDIDRVMGLQALSMKTQRERMEAMYGHPPAHHPMMIAQAQQVAQAQQAAQTPKPNQDLREQVAMRNKRARDMFMVRMGGVSGAFTIHPNDFLFVHIFNEEAFTFFCFGGHEGCIRESTDLYPSDQLIAQFRMMLMAIGKNT